jgi:hypothetical protein
LRGGFVILPESGKDCCKSGNTWLGDRNETAHQLSLNYGDALINP